MSSIGQMGLFTSSENEQALVIQGLRGWTFDIGDYMKDPDGVLRDAVGRIPGGKINVEDVRDHLHFLFRQRVDKAARWEYFPDPLSFGGTLIMIYEGEEHKAIICGHNRKLEFVFLDATHSERMVVTLPDCEGVTFKSPSGEALSEYGLWRAKETLLAHVLENRYLRVI